ncbi:hypothetical protein AX17_004845 [Amanita inopinata Kibby_2008]|nr:hypothetical protein AX17_004845 [Amanita inopinata Kibby_2008]
MFSLCRRTLQRSPCPALAPPLRGLHNSSLRQNYASLVRTSFHARPKASNVINAPRRGYSEFRERNTIGVFTPTSAALFILTGVGLLYYFRYEKAKLLEEREKERATKSYGRPDLGGPFSLTAADGKPFTDQDMLGKWNLVYFGFTNCPDICPAELDKIGSVLDRVVKEYGSVFQPIFISVDPARDTPARIQKYLEDFHPSFIGLVGSYDAIKAVCKQYRVYFSTPPNADPNEDYLVDHSIFIYLMDPEGKFVDAFGQSVGEDEVTEKLGKAIAEWHVEKGKKT